MYGEVYVCSACPTSACRGQCQLRSDLPLCRDAISIAVLCTQLALTELLTDSCLLCLLSCSRNSEIIATHHRRCFLCASLESSKLRSPGLCIRQVPPPPPRSAQWGFLIHRPCSLLSFSGAIPPQQRGCWRVWRPADCPPKPLQSFLHHW